MGILAIGTPVRIIGGEYQGRTGTVLCSRNAKGTNQFRAKRSAYLVHIDGKFGPAKLCRNADLARFYQ